MNIKTISFRNPLDLATNQLARNILNSVRRNGSNNYQDISEFNYKTFKIPINIILSVKPTDKNKIMVYCQYRSIQNIIGYLLNPNNYVSENREIKINIELPKTFNKTNYDELYKILVEQVRHELQHMKDDDSLLPIKTNFNPGYNINKFLSKNVYEIFEARTNYMMSVVEQEPFIRGLILKAKKQIVPFEKILDDFIKNQFFASDVNVELKFKEVMGSDVVDNKVKEIKNRYINKSKLIFPELRNGQ